jgi:hypothetical protein
MRTMSLILLLAATQLAHAAMTDKVTTEKIKTMCDIWVQTQDDPPRIHTLTAEEVNSVAHKIEFIDRCQAFINGISNAMIDAPAWLDDLHKRVVVGNWEDGVTVKQEILIFVDYVNQNPAALNKPVTDTFRKSMEAAGIYTYSTP